MKKFKLIKEYPGSPELNTIIERDSNCSNYYYKLIKSVANTFTPKNIENQPEFWEEVVEKDYEILSLISPNGPELITENNAVSNLIKNEKFKINSIKRLSDGEIFTIGDKVDSTISDLGRCTELTGFKIQNNKLLLGLRELGYYPLSSIIKPKQPLFTTEDGVDIYECDIFYSTRKDYTTGVIFKYIGNPLEEASKKSEYFVDFSTKEKAEEYVLLNKPCLSYNDIHNISQFSAINFKELKNLVKSKIQQSV